MAYQNTFISVSPDTKATAGQLPKARAGKTTVAQLEHQLLSEQPYQLTQEDLTFRVYLIRQGLDYESLAADEREQHWNTLFSKGQPCLRASSLTKTQGWGAHYDDKGCIGLYAMDSDEYSEFAGRDDLKQLVGMRSKR